MSSLLPKIFRLTKKQENMNHNYSTEIDKEMTETTELADNNVKTPTVNMLRMLRDIKEKMNIIRRGI